MFSALAQTKHSRSSLSVAHSRRMDAGGALHAYEGRDMMQMVKLERLGEKRRLRLPKPVRMSALCRQATELFQLPSATHADSMSFCYVDEDGDSITVTSQRDLDEAVRLSVGSVVRLSLVVRRPTVGAGSASAPEQAVPAAVTADVVAEEVAPHHVHQCATEAAAHLAAGMSPQLLAARGFRGLEVVRVMTGLGVNPRVLVKQSLVSVPVFRDWKRRHGAKGLQRGGFCVQCGQRLAHCTGSVPAAMHTLHGSGGGGGVGGVVDTDADADAGVGEYGAAVEEAEVYVVPSDAAHDVAGDPPASFDGGGAGSSSPAADPPTLTLSPSCAPSLPARGRGMPVQFVTHVTGADDTMVVAPGVEFDKVWRVFNGSDFAWPLRIGIADVGGASAGSSVPAVLTDATSLAHTAAQRTVDVSARVTVPTAPGSYRGVWRLTDEASGKAFGGRLWWSFSVRAGHDDK